MHQKSDGVGMMNEAVILSNTEYIYYNRGIDKVCRRSKVCPSGPLGLRFADWKIPHRHPGGQGEAGRRVLYLGRRGSGSNAPKGANYCNNVTRSPTAPEELLPIYCSPQKSHGRDIWWPVDTVETGDTGDTGGL